MQATTASPSVVRLPGSAAPLPALVLDLGTRTIKSGLHTASAPCLTPALVGSPKYPRCLPGFSPLETEVQVVGDAALQCRGLLRLHSPVRHGGVIADWTAARPLLRQSVHAALASSLCADTIPHRLRDGSVEVIYSLVESPFASRPQRARLAELLFEGGEVSSTQVGPRAAGVFCGVGPLLALYATGQTTGVVLDVGDGAVSTAAAVDGYALTPCLQREAGSATGEVMTAYLTRLLYQSGVLGPASAATSGSLSSSPTLVCSSFSNLADGAGAGTQQERELVSAIKERCCSVSSDPLIANTTSAAAPAREADLDTALVSTAQRYQKAAHVSGAPLPHSVELPDGHVLQVGAAEAMQAAEVLFCPSLMGKEGRGVADIVTNAIAAAPSDVRHLLLRNVVVTGGTSCCPGFGKRLFHDLLRRTASAAAPSSTHKQRICVAAPEQRAYAGWLGACYVAHLSTFASHMVVTRAVYEEEGEAALAKKLLT